MKPEGSEHTAEVNASDFRSVKLPTFWKDDSKLWFAMLEKEFAAYGIKSDAVKCASVLRHLDSNTVRVVADIISAPDGDDSYNRVKEALIDRLASSEETQLRQLFSGIELNGRKPSELLREMQLLSGTKVSGKALQTLWLQRLPTRIQEILVVMDNVPLDKLAILADKTIERSFSEPAAIAECEANIPANASAREQSAEIAALTRKLSELESLVRNSFNRRPRNRSRPRYFRGRSNSRNRSGDRSYRQGQQDFCYFHRRFKERSFRCVQPCNWTGQDARSNKEN
ncbi:uncharacterized protein LOC123988193 [Osmia bicornis bicornis]|uniref:uncharacterized protein LOC123988193 n=1 Tax=Osmia bicornis bicornis TaxID=1437191 RepID=UPI001EAF16FB|nr:uncharacterized protein LOC123988193 [Osmia bicornis bicornis]